jgi:hypothetical protein
MDVEEVQSVAQMRLRCLMLEVDKEAELLKSQQYRKILSELVGEEGTDAPRRSQLTVRPTYSGDVWHRVDLEGLRVSYHHISRGVDLEWPLSPLSRVRVSRCASSDSSFFQIV